jgi:hypothetical protein
MTRLERTRDSFFDGSGTDEMLFGSETDRETLRRLRNNEQTDLVPTFHEDGHADLVKGRCKHSP